MEIRAIKTNFNYINPIDRGMVRIITKTGKFDYIKWEYLQYWLEKGYIVALAE